MDKSRLNQRTITRDISCIFSMSNNNVTDSINKINEEVQKPKNHVDSLMQKLNDDENSINIEFNSDERYSSRDNYNELIQVEIYATPDVHNDELLSGNSPTSVGVLYEDGLKPTKMSYKQNKGVESSDEYPDEDEFKMSNIMNDHNYTSFQLMEDVHFLKQNITNLLLKRGKGKKDSLKVSDFVKNLLASINSFNSYEKNETDGSDCGISSLSVSENSRQVKDYKSDVETDFFVQNMINIVVEDDASELNNDDLLNDKAVLAVDHLESLSTAIVTDRPVVESAVAAEGSTIDRVTIKPSSFGVEEKSVDMGLPQALHSKEVVKLALKFNEHSKGSSLSKSEYTDEDELSKSKADLISETNKCELALKSEPTSPLLHELSTFANVLCYDCHNFAEATVDELKLKQYIIMKIEMLKAMANSGGPLCADKCFQTDKDFSKRKLRNLNTQNKQSLLSSSSSSSTSSSSSSGSSSSSSMSTSSPSTSSEESSDESLPSGTSKFSASKLSAFKDGMENSDVFQNGLKSQNSSLASEIKLPTDSDKENTNTAVGSPAGAKAASDQKISSVDLDVDDENDREIDRLVNLHSLGKRQQYSDSVKLSSTDKFKPKPPIGKSTHEILDFSDDDMQKTVVSDEVISESEEEILTEQQYLARCNENLKHQLLNGSSSEERDSSGISETELDPVESDGNGSRSPLPLIDKFLKSFNVEDSELEDLADSDTEKDNGNHEASIPPASSVISVEEKNANYEESLNNKKSSEGLSDCELIHDNTLISKRKRPKCLEKMLADADKRKKSSKLDDDLISLSSESDGSDIEQVDTETAETKSRLLKPMLRQDQLAGETRKAQKQEVDRIRRLEKKQVVLAKVLKDHQTELRTDDLVLDYVEETKTFIKVHPGIVKQLKQHQIDGVKFMYDSCYGGVAALKKNSGSGCILAHCMGLGKTLQLIALLHTVISYKELKTAKILVLCPKSTVMNWADEVVRWLGPLNTKNLKVFTFNDTSDIIEKLGVLREWSLSSFSKAGCLLIGYEAFRTLVFYHSYKNRGNVSSARLEDIREKVDTYLLQPGADLVVCDEGHIIKNNKSAISLAVAKIITPKRIVLTGTPIQNNLKEYYSMVNFIKPLFLGTEKEFANLYANPIKNGQHKDSNKRDIKVMKQRSFVLHKKLSKFVQRKEAELLKTFLPQKFEYVLFIPMTQVQSTLYEHILEAISKREENRGRSLITDYTCLRKIWTHPKVLEDAWKNATNQKNKKDARRAQNLAPHSEEDQPDDIYDSQTGLMSVTNDWWRHLLSENDLESVMPSNKLRTMFEILRMSEDKGEKCLIFSAFVAVLNVVEYFFKKISQYDDDTLKELKISKSINARSTWVMGQDYYRLDGKTPKSLRHEMIKRFNSAGNKRARVFLISAKAGGQGINLTGANRVIILDTSWNPSNDQQNIFRIFRLGQKKNCYIYRLLAMGSMEEKVYSRSVTKQAMSFRVVDEQQIDRHYSMAELAELYTLTKPDYSERTMPVFPQDSILASLLLNYPDLVFKYHEHDSLLENKVEQELSEQEKADAWAAYERDLQLSSEIREIPNTDEKQGIFTSSGVPNYFNALAGLDMQSLLNYSSLGQQAATSPFMQTLLSQYNYSTPPNQQYLDVYNMYRKMTQSSLGYPDISGPLGDPAVYAGSPYGMHLPKSVPAGAPMLTGHHRVPPTSNPLTALGDLSMYGLSPQKNVTHSSSVPSVNQSMTQQQLEAMFTSASSSCGGNMPAHSNGNVPFFGQYKQTLQNTFRNLYNYSGTSTDYMSPSMNKSKLSNSPHRSQFGSPAASPYNHLGAPQMDVAKLLEQNAYPNSKKVTEQQLQVESRPSDGNAIITPSAKKSMPQQRSIGLEPAGSSGSYDAIRGSNKSISYRNSYEAANASSLNMGIVYPNTNSSRTISGPASADLLKGNSEMQIIPTTNPPGTLSASMQLNEMSPSISLTAVTSVRSLDANERSSGQETDVESRNLMSIHNSGLSTNVANTESKSKSSISVNITSTVSGSSNVTKKQLLISGSCVNPKASASLSSANVTLKTAAAAAVAAKSSAQQKNYSLTTGLSSIGQRKRLQMASEQDYVSSSMPKSAEQLVRSEQQNVKVKPSMKSDASPEIHTPHVNVHFGSGSISRHPMNVKTQKKAGEKPKSRSSPDSYGVQGMRPVDAKVAIRTTSAPETLRESTVMSAHTATMPLQQRPPSQSSLAGGSLAAVKNTLNIRPVDNKQNPSGTGVYIIETNINERKVAIGTPTKSGGGTTVTKVPLEKKRPPVDAMSKDVNFVDAKRQRV